MSKLLLQILKFNAITDFMYELLAAIITQILCLSSKQGMKE